MRRIGLVIAVALLALGAAACRCPLRVETVDRLETSLKGMHGLYLRYVEADPKLDEDQKVIERENAKSQIFLVGTIREPHK